MRRYHAEVPLIRKRAAEYLRSITASGQAEAGGPPVGQFRKAWRCGGCCRSRCQLCHPEKYPRRLPTRREVQAARDLHDEWISMAEDRR